MLSDSRRPLSANLRNLRQALTLAPQKRSETQPVVELRQRGQVRRLALQRIRADAQAHVAADCRQPAREVHRLAVLTQPLAQTLCAAQLEDGDAAEIGVQLIERGKLLHERRGRLVPDSRHPGDVVNLVPGERQVIGETLRRDSEVALDVAIAELLARPEIPQQIAVPDELREILVACDESRAHARSAHEAPQRADDVVRLVFPVDEYGEAEMPTQLPAALELQRETGGRRVAVRLVGRV